jgi:hypothetical protein
LKGQQRGEPSAGPHRQDKIELVPVV